MADPHTILNLAGIARITILPVAAGAAVAATAITEEGAGRTDILIALRIFAGLMMFTNI